MKKEVYYSQGENDWHIHYYFIDSWEQFVSMIYWTLLGTIIKNSCKHTCKQKPRNVTNE